MQKDLIELLGGKCKVCNSTENLHVNHRWYVAEDKGTGGKWKKILALYEKNPKRFSCLCSRHNQLAGALCAVINNPADIYELFMDEVSKMVEGRKNSSVSYHTLSLRLHNQCVICNKQINGKGKTCSKECQDNLDVSRRKKYVADPRIKVCAICGKTFQQRSNSKTCGKECGKKYRYKHHLFAHRKYKECVICGGDLTGKGKTCSDECSVKLRLNTSRKKEHRRSQNIQLECKICNKLFLREYPRQITCNDECKLQWLVKAKTDDCVVCGKTFNKRTGNQITCSSDCMAQRLYPAQMIKCTICDKTFQRKSNSKTCSNECSEELRARRRRERHLNDRHLVTLKCVVCGNMFDRLHGVQKTCSDGCKLSTLR